MKWLVVLLMVVSISGCVEVPTIDSIPKECTTQSKTPIDIPGPVISIVLEGGFRTDYTDAYPILLEKGYRATTYIVGSHMGFENYLDWPELSVLVANGWDVGTCGYHGYDLTKLDKCTIGSELDRDIDEVSHQLCYKISSMIAPYDSIDDRLLYIAEGRGISTILSARSYPSSAVKVKIDGLNYSVLYDSLKNLEGTSDWLVVSFGRLKYCSAPDMFRQVVGMISSSGIQVATVEEVVKSGRMER